jgi:hypothetical protein
MGLSKIESETLLLLANRGPLTGYDLHSKKNENRSGENADTNIMSDVYWLKVKKKLVKHHMIKEYPEKGRRKPYILTEDGFDYILRIHIDDISDFDTFADYCRDFFPLVFGYWDDLKEHGLCEYVAGNLKTIIRVVYVDVVRELVLGWRTKYTHQEFIEDLYTRIYVPELYHFEDDTPDAVPFNEIRIFRKSKLDLMNFIQRWKTREKNKANNRIERLEHLE